MKKSKPIIIPRLHEQRENFSNKTFTIDKLRKQMFVEVVDWNHKTERVKIHKCMKLKSYEWTEDKKYKYLTLNLKNIDLEQDKKNKIELINKIMLKHTETLKYSLVQCMIEGMQKHEESGYLIDLKTLEKKLKEKNKTETAKDEFNFYVAHEKI